MQPVLPTVPAPDPHPVVSAIEAHLPFAFWSMVFLALFILGLVAIVRAHRSPTAPNPAMDFLKGLFAFIKDTLSAMGPDGLAHGQTHKLGYGVGAVTMAALAIMVGRATVAWIEKGNDPTWIFISIITVLAAMLGLNFALAKKWGAAAANLPTAPDPDLQQPPPGGAS